MQLCSRREYCRKEIVDKLISWDCTPTEVCEVVDFLVEQGFLDERRYTEAFAKDKIRFNKWGRVKISYMLRSQDIDRNTIMDVFSEIDEKEYCRLLFDELQKKHRTVRGNAVEIRGKLFRFAAGRGFEQDIIHEAISKIFD